MIRFRGNKLVIRLCLPNQSFHFLSVEALECKSYNYKSLVEGLNVINGPKCNKKTPEGVYAGFVGLRKNYGYVEWQWKVV